ncbi:HlyD family secretion protein [Thioclava sp. BHET1]|nr:HlyD family secretion protein [Thioclava sp. BHET1]
MDPQKTPTEDSPVARDAEVKPFPARPETAPEQPAAAPAAPAAAAGPAAASAPPKGGRRKYILGTVGIVVLALAAHYGYDYWTVGRFMVSTDDAYLKTDITTIAPKVEGYIDKIDVVENQHVKAGQLLLTLDNGDYLNALKTAQNQVATQQQTIARIGAQIEAGQASVAQAEAQKLADQATLKNAQLTYDRAQKLATSSFAAQSTVDDATAALDQAKAGVTGADAQIEAAKANVDVLIGQQKEAQSQLGGLQLAVDQANRNLGRTTLRAPVDGTVANIAAHVGDLVTPGQTIAALVPTRAIYIEANYKETQLGGIAPGAEADISIDAIPDKVFHGKVLSVSPATGSEFSLIPPQNATGNFTKIVQRVPVRISLPKELLDSGKLHAGLSVVVDVDSRTASGSTKAGE